MTPFSYITKPDVSGRKAGRISSRQEAESILSTFGGWQEQVLSASFVVHKRLEEFCALLSEVKGKDISKSDEVVDKIKLFICNVVEQDDL